MVQAMLGRGCSHFARAALVGLLVCASAAPALAQGEDESEARMHFRVGRAYYDSGRFLEAAHEFEEAYRQSDRPQLLYNIFVAYRDAGRLQEAMEALRRYLELVPDAENRDQLTARLAAMERVAARGGRLVNADITLICEAPKIGPHSDPMRARLAEIMEVPKERISVKATTTERLGFPGRGEGIAAQAVATLALPRPVG